MKAYAVIAIGGAIILTGSYLYSINNAQYKIAIVVSGRIHKISAQGVTVIISYNIKNPTASTMRMTPPMIKISINGKQLAVSDMEAVEIPDGASDDSGKIIIRANQETGNIESSIMIPWLSIVSITPDLLNRFQNPDAQNKIEVQAQILTRIYTLVGSFPYDSTSTVKL